MPLNCQKERWGLLAFRRNLGPNYASLVYFDEEQIFSAQQQIKREKWS
jgi:hypothetical protein